MNFFLITIAFTFSAHATIDTKFVTELDGRKKFSMSWSKKENKGSVEMGILANDAFKVVTQKVVSLEPKELLGCQVRGVASAQEKIILIRLQPVGLTCEYVLLGFLFAQPIRLVLESGQEIRVHGTPFQVCADVDSCSKRNGSLASRDINQKAWRLSDFDGSQQSWRDPATGIVWGKPQNTWSFTQAQAEAFCNIRGMRLPKTLEIPDDVSVGQIFRLIDADAIYWSANRSEAGLSMGWAYSATSLSYVGDQAKYSVICVAPVQNQ